MLDTEVKVFHESISHFMKWPERKISQCILPLTVIITDSHYNFNNVFHKNQLDRNANTILCIYSRKKHYPSKSNK